MTASENFQETVTMTMPSQAPVRLTIESDLAVAGRNHVEREDSVLASTVAMLLLKSKGILAADESLPTIAKRFAVLNIIPSEENRRSYREMLFTTPGLGEFVSGVILFDETMRQRTQDGVPLAEVLAKQGIIPGIKVDKATEALANFTGERLTQGLDGLRNRLIEYRGLGARFTKWRAVIAVGEDKPSRACIAANAQALALFAGLSQEAGLVPIVEPEVLMTGSHTIDCCEAVTTFTLQRVFDALSEQRVELEHMLLKTGMVLSGSECPTQADSEVVAASTLRCLRRAVPVAVPGIVFLSGGQSEEAATQRLNAICRVGAGPWRLSFSFGRALQDPVLKAWNGSAENSRSAQAKLHHRALCNWLATQGKYSADQELKLG